MTPSVVPRRSPDRGTARRTLLTSAAALLLTATTTAGTSLASPTRAVAPTKAGAPTTEWCGKAVRTIPTSAHVAALTFNAAWDDQGLDTVLTVLRQQKAPATFFPTGKFAERHPEAVRSIARAGHGIGNHSHTHPPFGVLTPAERAEEIALADRAIRAAAGQAPLPFFRFPYGAMSAAQIAQVNSLGLADIEWTTDTNGYLGTVGGMTVQKVVKRALDALRPGEIVQMHVGSLDGGDQVLDAEALPQIIDAVRSRGYRFVDLATLVYGPLCAATPGAPRS